MPKHEREYSSDSDCESPILKRPCKDADSPTPMKGHQQRFSGGIYGYWVKKDYVAVGDEKYSHIRVTPVVVERSVRRLLAHQSKVFHESDWEDIVSRASGKHSYPLSWKGRGSVMIGEDIVEGWVNDHYGRGELEFIEVFEYGEDSEMRED